MCTTQLIEEIQMKSIASPLQYWKNINNKQKFEIGIIATGALLVGQVISLALSTSALAQPLSQTDRQLVDNIVTSVIKDGKQPGVSISITGPKGDYAKSYGIASSIPKRALSLNDHFRIGSVTKSFTATAILMQVDKGTVSLDDTLDKYVSGVPNGDIITVRQLLMMRSGVFDYQADPAIAAVFSIFPTWQFSPEGALQSIRKHPSQFAPGSQYQYTNSNYQLLGMILEKVTGKKYQNVIKDDIVTPLGLTKTSLPANATMPTPYAKGYSPLFLGLYRDVTAINPALFGAAGSMVSTVDDQQKWGAAMRDGTLLKPATHALSQATFCPVPYTGEGPSAFGYGLGLIQLGRWIGHNGSIPGYGAITFYDQQSGAIITGMETMQTSDLSVFSRIMQRIGAQLYPGSMETPAYPEC